MTSSERKIQSLERELSQIKDEKSFSDCLAQSAKQQKLLSDTRVVELQELLYKEHACRMEAERRLQEEIQSSFNLKKRNEVLSSTQQNLDAVLQEKQLLEEKLAEALKTIKKLEKKLNIRKGTEDPYGINTPSSRKVAKANSTEENRKKKGGAIIGHTGHGRTQFKKGEADEIRQNTTSPEISCCENPDYCAIGTKTNSFIDFIPMQMKIVYEENTLYQCKHCGKQVVSPSPDALPKAKYSNIATSILLEEAFGNLMPYGTIAEHYGINKGTLIGTFHRMGKIFLPLFLDILGNVKNYSVVHADETTWSMDGKRAYVWFFAADDFRLYLFRETRGSIVPKEVFDGSELLALILVTDRYGGYNSLPVHHQYCFVHLLRDLKNLEIEFPNEVEVKNFVDSFIPLLQEAISLHGKEIPIDLYRQTAEDLKKQIMAICNSPANHPGIQKYQDIFRFNEERLFQWIDSPEIPCENNFAERNLRPVVIARKMSFGCQSEQGMRTREIMMTVIQSIICQGLKPLPFIQRVLSGISSGISTDPVAIYKEYCATSTPESSNLLKSH